jgi:myo-inositol 2-dehydrogenase/D-chiro-inositol 1-dehydrogenase
MADYHQLLDDPTIDAVVICSLSDTHARISQEAASAGKHIFCEKPIALDLASIDRTLQAVAQARVKFQVGFHRRFDPSFRKVRQMVVEGKIGTPHLLRITSRDPEPPALAYLQVSGGIFLDMTIHDFDMARYLIGSEVGEIYAVGAVRLDQRIQEVGDMDTTLVTLRFENGVIGSVDNSRGAVYGHDQRVEVFGSAGMLSVSNQTPDVHVYSNAQGVYTSLPFRSWWERYSQSYWAEMKAFVECIGKDEPPPVSGLDGRMSVAMGLAAQRSCREHRPVALSEIA